MNHAEPGPPGPPPPLLRQTGALLLGYVVALVNIVAVYFLLDLIKIIELGIMFVGGMGIGYGFGCVRSFTGLATHVAFAAFLAALTFWMPMVIATFGFALLATPVLALYSLAVLLGWRLATRCSG